MNMSRFLTLLTVAVAAIAAGCTVSRTPAPPLQGPSELALSLTIAANPDVLSMDGASQSQITVETRDANGQLQPNVALRAEILANGTIVDFGSLSARTFVTGSNGRAAVTYTAPVAVSGAIPSLSIRITPTGTDAANLVGRFVDIRLVPPGVITGGGPTPSFTVTPAGPTAFTDARFDASASTASLGASIVGYSWDFGDGSAASGVTATHRFSASGTFHAVLTVTDSNGVSASKSQDIVVGGGAAPTADFTVSPASPLTNQEINFNGGLSTAGAGHSIVRYAWNFGSGSPQSGVTVTKSYDVAGTYSVTLTVTDEAGQTAQTTKGVTVTASASGSGTPTPLFTFSPASPGVRESVFFNASTSTAGTGHTIASYAWTFGDGATATGVTATHAYSTAGTYSVQLKVTDDAGQSTTSAAVSITAGNPPAPTANFTSSPTGPVVGDNIVFDASLSTTAQGQTITNLAWNFGDNTPIISCPGAATCVGTRIISHAYTAAGTYVVNLVVTDSAGRIGSHAASVLVGTGNPQPLITFSPSTGASPITIGFSSTGSILFSGATVASYAWNFGDPVSGALNSSASANPTHLYNFAGTYTVRLTITDSLGRVGTITVTVTIT